MKTTPFAVALLLALTGGTAAMAQDPPRSGSDAAATARTRDAAPPEPEAARRAAELDPRSHSYGLHARHDIRTTKTREEVRAELMEARAAEARLRRGERVD
jgi:hypothetical protein